MHFKKPNMSFLAANKSATTIADYLRAATAQLALANIESARLDALILLEDALQLDRAYLLAHDDAVLSPEHLRTLYAQITQRQQHIPIAYIRGHTEFYGRRFIVNKHVLVPRPESESMIELLKSILHDIKCIADIGTGSGALAVTAALELPAAHVIATDIDAACLAVAQQNANQYNVAIEFLTGNLLKPISNSAIDVLLCNLPYVPDNYPINDAARHEPSLALFAGPDGLDAYRSLTEQLSKHRRLAPHIITESLQSQHTDMATVLLRAGYTLVKTHNLAQYFRRASR